MAKLFQCFCLIGAVAAFTAATVGCASEPPFEPDSLEPVADWQNDPYGGKADGAIYMVGTAEWTAALTVVTAGGAAVPPAAVIAVGVLVVGAVAYVVWSHRDLIGQALEDFRDAVAAHLRGAWSLIFTSYTADYDVAAMVIPTPGGLVQSTATPAALDRETVRQRIQRGQCTDETARWIQNTIIGPQCHYDWATFSCGGCTDAANWVSTLDTCIEWRDLQIQCWQQVGGLQSSPRNLETHRHAVEVARGHRNQCQALLDSSCGGRPSGPAPVETPPTECEVAPGVKVPLYQIVCDTYGRAYQCVNPSGVNNIDAPNSRWARNELGDSRCQ